MRWRSLILLYLGAAALGVAWRREMAAPPPADPGLPAARRRFLPVDAAAVHEVRITHGPRTVLLQRWEGEWRVAEPEDAGITTGLVEAFVAALAATEEIQRVAETEGDGSAYGLGPGAVDVEVRRNGAPVCRVLLGSTNPTGTAVYARRTDDPAVYLIGRNVAYYEGMLFQALPAPGVPAGGGVPVGG